MKFYHLIIVLIIVPLLLCIYSCNHPQKSKIELKFEEYVHKNFASPSDLVEIACIELDDSLDIKEFLDLYLNGSCHPDSIESKVTEQMILIDSLAKRVPIWFKQRNRDYIMQLLTSEESYLTLYPKWELLKDEYEKVDSLNLIQRMYVIKARVKQGDRIVMKNFYATDYMIIDSIAISDEKILHKDSPKEVLALTDALDSYMRAVRSKMDYLQEIVNFNNKQQQVSM